MSRAARGGSIPQDLQCYVESCCSPPLDWPRILQRLLMDAGFRWVSDAGENAKLVTLDEIADEL